MKTSTYVPNKWANGTATTAHQRGASAADTSTVSTLTLGTDTSAVLISVETTSARVTFDGSNPGAASAPSNVYPKDLAPAFVAVGAGTVVKWVSTAAAVSVVQICELR